MTDEVEVKESEEQAAFEAGFAGSAVEEPPAQTEEPVQEAAPVEEAEVAEPERNQWGYTDEEMKTLLSKASKVDALEQQLADERQKIYGKLGEYNRTIQNMQQQTGKPSLSAPQLTHLKSEFPELAELLAKDFGEVMVSTPEPQKETAPAFDPSAFDDRVRSVELNIKKETLSTFHPDWEEVKESDQFATWVGLQPDDVRQQIGSSQNIGFAVRMLNTFKEWRDQTVKASTKKTARLEQAVAPTGVKPSAPPAMDENDAFLAGFKSVRG